MNQDHASTASHMPDASDIVAGPVGEARLRDPSTSGPMGADLGELAAIDSPAGDLPGTSGSIDGEPGPPTLADRYTAASAT